MRLRFRMHALALRACMARRVRVNEPEALATAEPCVRRSDGACPRTARQAEDHENSKERKREKELNVSDVASILRRFCFRDFALSSFRDRIRRPPSVRRRFSRSLSLRVLRGAACTPLPDARAGAACLYGVRVTRLTVHNAASRRVYVGAAPWIPACAGMTEGAGRRAHSASGCTRWRCVLVWHAACASTRRKRSRRPGERRSRKLERTKARKGIECFGCRVDSPPLLLS